MGWVSWLGFSLCIKRQTGANFPISLSLSEIKIFAPIKLGKNGEQSLSFWLCSLRCMFAGLGVPPILSFDFDFLPLGRRRIVSTRFEMRGEYRTIMRLNYSQRLKIVEP
ncbi:unnamed protein product [Citrullus colocynthis]|uniref:Uncharacterized protein n=1 Tax=Citrullus colocynthis TaxID=252529 RepID=A0ABP0YJ19_9ROSI